MHRATILGAALLAAAVSGASTACTGTIGGPEDDGSPSFTPAPAKMRRLLKRQYVGSVRTLLGEEAAAASRPPNDSSVNGFDSIGAAQLGISDSALGYYELSGRAVASAAMGNMPRIHELLGCQPKGPGDAECHRQFVARFGRLAWRRSLTHAEVDRYTALAQVSAKEANDFFEGVEFAIAAFLQSPNFLYMVEIGAPVAGDAERRRLTDNELLTRMSLFLLDSTPDAALLDLVEKEGLRTDDQIERVAKMMLQRPAARVALGGFFSELYRLRDLDTMVKDASTYPMFSSVLAQSMKEETLRLIEDVVWVRDTDIRELFTTDYTFANAELAALYGIPAPPGSGFIKVTLPREQRRNGLLGQPSFLARFAHTARTSPTLRGRFVRERVLCQLIPPPPADVVTTLPEDDPGEPKTMKEKLAQHRNDPACSSCHKLMDGIGLAFEEFDGIGAFRTEEGGTPIDSGTQAEGIGQFSNPKELGAKLRENELAAACLLKNLYRNATGHIETEEEDEVIEDLELSFRFSGYRVRELLVDIVVSPAFRTVGVPR